jgi:predicted DNA-binding transcriptional regulator AlpA
MVVLMNTHNEKPLWNRQVVLDETNLSRATIDRLERAGHFPQRVQLSPRRVAWKAEEIRRWIATRQRAYEAQGSPDASAA